MSKKSISTIKIKLKFWPMDLMELNFMENCGCTALLLRKNKPTCARVAAMTTVAHNKSKRHSLNAKVNFSLMLPYA